MARRFIRAIVGGVVGFGVFVPFVVSAVEGDDLLQVLDQENKVYAASRYEQDIADTPASVSVLTREDILAFRYFTLEQAILSLPGVHDASTLAWPMFGIRGMAKPGDICSRFAVLINGVPANYDPVFGGTCFQLLDIESLKRVEFVRGPGSSVYGSGASLGVFNLVTEDAGDESGLYASVKGQSSKEGRVYVSYNGLNGRLKYFSSLSALYRKGSDFYFKEYDVPSSGTDGWSRGNDGQRRFRHFARLEFGQSWLQWRLEQNLKHDPVPVWQTVFNSDHLQYDDRSFSIEAAHTFDFAGGQTLLRVYFTRFNEYGNYPFYYPPAQNIIVADYRDDINTSQLGGEVRVDAYLSNSHHILAGADARGARGQQVGGYTTIEKPDHDFDYLYGLTSLYAQDEFPFVGGFITAGGRFDNYIGYSERVRGRFNPRAAYITRLSSSSSLKILYGEAFRAPTQYELFYRDDTSIVQNEKLSPEVTRSLEAMVEYTGFAGMRGGLSVYATRLRDAIVLRSSDVCSGCTQYKNLPGYQQIMGVEGTLTIRRDEGFRAYLSFNAQTSRNTSEGTELPASPRLLVKGGFSSSLGFLGLRGGADARYTSRVLGTDMQDLSRSGAPDFLDLGLFAMLPLRHSGWNFSVRIDNALDQRGYIVQSQIYEPLHRTPITARQVAISIDYGLN